MAENRLKRDAETREKTVRKKAWSRPTVLPDPIPQEGYKFHWVRVSTMGQPDSTNVSSKLREGWEPVRAEDHPEIFSDAVADARFHGRPRKPVHLNPREGGPAQGCARRLRRQRRAGGPAYTGAEPCVRVSSRNPKGCAAPVRRHPRGRPALGAAARRGSAQSARELAARRRARVATVGVGVT